MTNGLNIAIVGAGIGGLSAALALSARGMNVTVFEGAESPREAGAGLSIPPNAVALLKRTSLCDDFEKITTRSLGLTLRTSRGEPVPRPPADLALLELIRFTASSSSRCYLDVVNGTGSISDIVVLPSMKLKHGARLSFANGTACDADVVIGADGIHSIVTARDRPDGEPD